MGKSAAELNPLIEDGGKTYTELANTLQKYNLDFIDQETLDQANAFNDSLDTIKAVIIRNIKVFVIFPAEIINGDPVIINIHLILRKIGVSLLNYLSIHIY